MRLNFKILETAFHSSIETFKEFQNSKFQNFWNATRAARGELAKTNLALLLLVEMYTVQINHRLRTISRV